MSEEKSEVNGAASRGFVFSRASPPHRAAMGDDKRALNQGALRPTVDT